jgi:hypothetical protein
MNCWHQLPPNVLILCAQAKRISSAISMAASFKLDQQYVILVTDLSGPCRKIVAKPLVAWDRVDSARFISIQRYSQIFSRAAALEARGADAAPPYRRRG